MRARPYASGVAHDLEDARATYLQLADQLRRAIAAGEYPTGARVPAIRTLAAEHEVAPATAAKAVALLKREGVLTVLPGKGTVVRDASAVVEPVQDQLNALRRRVEALEKRLGR